LEEGFSMQHMPPQLEGRLMNCTAERRSSAQSRAESGGGAGHSLAKVRRMTKASVETAKRHWIRSGSASGGSKLPSNLFLEDGGVTAQQN
jgi:hypothetical protein